MDTICSASEGKNTNMERTEIVAAIERSVAEVLRQDVQSLPESSRLLEDLNLDSTALLELLMAVEDQLSIEIDTSEMSIDDFATIGSLADHLASTMVNA
jgi:acyl carrier protein